MDAVDQAQEIEEYIAEKKSHLDRKKRKVRFSFGQNRSCKKCGQQIPKKRLEAVPFAIRCVQCQTEHEAGKKKGVNNCPE